MVPQHAQWPSVLQIHSLDLAKCSMVWNRSCMVDLYDMTLDFLMNSCRQLPSGFKSGVQNQLLHSADACSIISRLSSFSSGECQRIVEVESIKALSFCTVTVDMPLSSRSLTMQILKRHDGFMGRQTLMKSAGWSFGAPESSALDQFQLCDRSEEKKWWSRTICGVRVLAITIADKLAAGEAPQDYVKCQGCNRVGH